MGAQKFPVPHKGTTYKCWHALVDRCRNPKCVSYDGYGARGITVCDEWADSYECFLRDMGLCPDGMTIERINNDGPYTKANCVWASRKQQAQNRRSTQFVTINGETKCIADWARAVGIRPQLVGLRMFRGWPVEQAILTPPKRRAQHA